MKMLVDTVIEAADWQAFGLEALAERSVRAVLGHLGLGSAGFEVSLLGCDDARIAALNGDFRGKRVATNVLSWPAEDLAPEGAGGGGRATGAGRG